jgi:hypothetical protein
MRLADLTRSVCNNQFLGVQAQCDQNTLWALSCLSRFFVGGKLNDNYVATTGAVFHYWIILLRGSGYRGHCGNIVAQQ